MSCVEVRFVGLTKICHERVGIAIGKKEVVTEKRSLIGKTTPLKPLIPHPSPSSIIIVVESTHSRFIQCVDRAVEGPDKASSKVHWMKADKAPHFKWSSYVRVFEQL